MKCAGLLAAALALLATSVPRPAPAAVRWGLVAGPQWSQFNGFSTDPLTLASLGPPRPQWELGPMFGIGLGVPAGRWSLETELQFVDQRNVIRYPDIGFGITEHHLSLAFPARVALRLPHGFRLGAGPEARYLVRATSQPRAAGIIFNVAAPHASTGPAALIFENSVPDVTPFYRRWITAFQASFGIAWPIAEHEGRFDVRYSRALSETSTRLPGNVKARGVQGLLGITW